MSNGHWTYLTRTYDFPASHRLFNPDFSDADNVRIFRECNNPNGHGHNYELHVTVKGQLDPETGMIVDIWELDTVVKARVLECVDHKNLNVDVDFMQGLIPTAENIVVALWGELAGHVPGEAKLARLRLIETKNNFVEFTGH